MAKLTKTSRPASFAATVRTVRAGRCDCSYAVVWRHRGRQSTETFPTLASAREAKGETRGGRPAARSREPFEDYARQWIVTYRGRTSRGLSERTRATYRRDMERWAIPYFRGCRLEEIEPPDVRAFIGHLEEAGLRANSIRSILAPVKAMYATAVEDGAVRVEPDRQRPHRHRPRGRRARPGSPGDDPRRAGHGARPYSRRSGACCSSCWPTPACGSARPSA